jgi:uncharacterized protein (TIGR00369 family)
MTDHTGPHDIRLDQWIDCAPFERLLNISIDEAADGKAVLTMPFYERYAQGAGLMHGGALVSLADTAVVMAIKSLLPPGTHFATVSMEVKLLYPVRQGIVTARAEITDRQERTLHGHATVCNEEGRAVMEFGSVFKIARPRPAEVAPD